MKQVVLTLIVLLIGNSQNVMAQAQTQNQLDSCPQLINDCKQSWETVQNSSKAENLNACIERCTKAREKCSHFKEEIPAAHAHRLSCKNMYNKKELSKKNNKKS